MKLKSLEIKLNRWGEFEGQYTGKVCFEGDAGDLGVNLSPEVTSSFLALAGELLVAHVEVAGKALQDSIDVSVSEAIKGLRPPKEVAAAMAETVKLLTAEKDHA